MADGSQLAGGRRCYIGSISSGLSSYSRRLRIIFYFMIFIQLSWQQKDPLNDFCRRFGQQSTVIDRRLYLDGGLVDWNPISQNPANYSNTWLLYCDLNTSPVGVGVPQLSANLSKNASIPDVSGGVLWPDDVNKRFYLYGGDYFEISPNQYSLFSYDALYNQWESFGAPSTPIDSVSWGGGVGVSELGQGYMLGGWLSNNSVAGWDGGPLATSTLIIYDMDTGVWTNNTGPDSTPRAEGQMIYIPASDSGLLVYFGGVTAPYDNNTIVESPMSTIYVYDIVSSKWYTQTASGDVPLSRRRFCAGATWASDQSSYNIYLYGGLGFGANSTGFDDVYILSLPSFTWIQWWPTSPGIGKPHHSMTCNVIDGAQMLVTGGTFPLTDDCDSPGTWGIHNLDLGKQNPQGKMWNNYNPNITSYVVPPEIISVVGGSSLGGATATAPAGGFDNRDLSVYFAAHANVASRTPTRAIPTPTPKATNSTTLSPTPKRLSSGAIAGIAIGGVFVLILILAGCCVLFRRRTKTQPPPPSPYNSGYPQSNHTNYESQYSHEQTYEPQYQQLHGNPIPVELATNIHQLRHEDPKYSFPQLHEEHPIYDSWQTKSPLPPPPTLYEVPSLTSPHPSTFSSSTENSGSNPTTMYGSQISPTTTYSTVGRTRRPVPRNETFYSP